MSQCSHISIGNPPVGLCWPGKPMSTPIFPTTKIQHCKNTTNIQYPCMPHLVFFCSGPCADWGPLGLLESVDASHVCVLHHWTPVNCKSAQNPSARCTKTRTKLRTDRKVQEVKGATEATTVHLALHGSRRNCSGTGRSSMIHETESSGTRTSAE